MTTSARPPRWNIEQHFWIPPERPGEDGVWDWNLVAFEATREAAMARVQETAPHHPDISTWRVRRSDWLRDARQWEDEDGFDEFNGGVWAEYR